VADPSEVVVAGRTVRVDIDLLDTVLRQVGELVLARNQLISHRHELADGGRSLQRFSTIVSELEEDVMKTRMQPVEQLWAKLPRVVRDLAAQLGKEVALSLEGGGTEVDRTVLEAVRGSVAHLVHNAVGHGIEAPEVREELGKPRSGTLRLSASQDDGQVALEIADDGAGIDLARVGAEAVKVGVVTAEDLARMSTWEVAELVFRPGPSTAETVTSTSGSGLAMDVVRTDIERIGGSVELFSEPRAGTTVRIKIPLTLAIVPALLVACGESRYAVPQAAVQELVHLEGQELRDQVDQVGTARVCRLRGHLLPLLHLASALGHEAPPLSEVGALDIVVTQVGGERLGLVVDSVEGTEEIVVKPLARHLKDVSVYAGATVLGDGGVALVLDMVGLAGSARVTNGRALAAQVTGEPPAEGRAEGLLLLRVGDDRRVAVPLAWVARLEELGADLVEGAGGRRVAQYRGGLLPLVWLADVLGVAPGTPSAVRLPVVVCSDGRRSVGIVADQILDVIEEAVRPNQVGAAPAMLGTVVVQGRATDLLDVQVAASYAGVALERGTLDLAFGARLDHRTEVPACAHQ
jgi:two-component system chemotaxis sensor kinase CheA